jgi:esterase/lipase superfamily enzyme
MKIVCVAWMLFIVGCATTAEKASDGTVAPAQPAIGSKCTSTGASLLVDGKEYSIAERDVALQAAFSRVSGAVDNLIVYVHGRGKEPQKSVRKIISHVEREYSASLLMFHWCPSWSGPFGWPEDEARAAADELAFFIDALNGFVANNPAHKTVPKTLLSHSMGALVLEAYFSKYYDASKPWGFDTTVLSAPATAADSHARWLGRVGSGHRVYSTLNHDDGILSKAAKRTGGARLGQKLGKPIPLAAGVSYIDVTKERVGGRSGHQYFFDGPKRHQAGSRAVKAFFQSVLNGKAADLSAVKRKRGQIYRFEG